MDVREVYVVGARGGYKLEGCVAKTSQGFKRLEALSGAQVIQGHALKLLERIFWGI